MSRSGRSFLGAALAFGLLAGGAAHGQAVTDEWSSVKLPDPPAVKPVTVDAKTTALIVMDFNKEGCTEQKRPRCVKDLPHIAKLLKEARDHHLLVIHTLTSRTNLPDIVDSLKPATGEQAIKGGPDKFIKTDLDKMLKDKGIKTVMLVGTSANGAVLFTAGGAAQLDYKVIVPVDGMPADGAYQEQFAAWDIANGPTVREHATLTKIDLIKF